MGAFYSCTGALRNNYKEKGVTEIIVFAVGLLVSTLVVFGIFSRVPLEMHDSREIGTARAATERD